MQALKNEILKFEDILSNHSIPSKRKEVSILQLNIGKRCNQACAHCHVDSSPYRTENMDKGTIDRILELLSCTSNITTIDITGGAPELNPNFRYLVKGLKQLGKKVIDRCNLTVFFEEGQEDTPEFLAENKVEITSSLPCYLEKNVDEQRGDHVFKKSIRALKILNSLGYGKENNELVLNLVYNPTGANLPPEQSKLEAEYKFHLKNAYEIEFNRLLTINNMPIKRYERLLAREGKLEAYYRLLQNKFNPAAAAGIMCRSLISVGWDGKLYDCDFNQALDIPLGKGKKTVWEISDFNDIAQVISFGNHCFGCTAGNGSSCGGALL